MSNPELLEVVELPNGEVVLRRADTSEGSGEPLVSIRFSDEAKAFLGEHASSVGKSMIGAGLQLVGLIFRQHIEEEAGSEEIMTEENEEDSSSLPDKGKLH